MSEDTTEIVPNPPAAPQNPAAEGGEKAEAPKPRRRRRTAKTEAAPEQLPLVTPTGEVGEGASGDAPSTDKAVNRRRSSTRKSAAKSADDGAEGVAPAPRRRGRPRKTAAKPESGDKEKPADRREAAVRDGIADSASGSSPDRDVSQAERDQGSAQSQVEAADAEAKRPNHEVKSHDAAGQEEGPQDRTRTEDQASGNQPEDSNRGNRHRRHQRDRNRSRNLRTPQQSQNGSQQGNRRRNNRRNSQPEKTVEPSLTMEMLGEMKVAELRSKAAELKIEYVGLRKAELTQAIYEAAAIAEGFRPVEGILDIQNEGYGFLRTGNYMQGDNDAFVHQQLIRQYGLRAGDKIKGTMNPGRSNKNFPPLGRIEKVNDADPELARNRPRFRDLTPIYPNERLVMEHGKDSITGRAIDLVAPIGKGQRGLIVSPPKAGKTTVLKHICQSIAANNPEVHLFCLLVDERPEEVTDMERSIKGEVVASTFDMPASNHTAVSELVIEHAKRLVEMGEDVVVVLDSITRLARAYNLAAPASGRILSGGVDSAALYPPKKFLGAARNIENGGSLTILASALVDTGSKMDEVIFEEFKGTGNMELKLDRDLADKRVFPAIDPVASGTRNEELLLDPQLTPFIWGLRRVLANMNSTERAATALVKGLRATNDNEEFLIRSAKKAQQMEY